MANQFITVDGKLLMTDDSKLVTAPDEENLNDLMDEQDAITTLMSETVDETTDLLINGVIDGSPKGAYENLSALQTALPNGASGVYVTTDNGHWYYWNGTQYVSGGVYQASEIADGSITTDKLADGSVTPQKTSFMELKEGINFLKTNNGTYELSTSAGVVFGELTITNHELHITFDSRESGLASIIAIVPYEGYRTINLKNNTTYILSCFGRDNTSNYGGIRLYTQGSVKVADLPIRKGNGVDGCNYTVFTTDSTTDYTNLKLRLIIPSTEAFDFTMRIQLEVVNESNLPTKWTTPFNNYIDTGTTELMNLYYNNLQSQINEMIKHQEFEKMKNKYRYLCTTFIGTSNDGLVLLGSNDLKTFDLVKGKGVYTAINKGDVYENNPVRDPAIIQIGDYYYLAYTVVGWSTGSKIGMCKTKNFIDFEELSDLVVYDSDETTLFNKVWTPAWYREGNNIYIISSCQKVNDGNKFNCYIHKYDVDNHTLSEGYNTGVIYIDAHIHKENGVYYLIAGGCRVFKANSLLGTYSKITINLPTDFPTLMVEANFLIKKDNGTYRLFFQRFISGEETNRHMYYMDTDNLENGFTEYHEVLYTPTALEYARTQQNNDVDVEYWHWTIFDFNNLNGNNNNIID